MFLVVAAVWASSGVAAASSTCTDSWLGGDGNWFTASGWSSGTVPGPDDAVCITAPGNYTVTALGGPAGPASGQAVAGTLQLGTAPGSQKLVIEADNGCGDSTGTGGLEVFDPGGIATAASLGSNGQVELTQDGNTCSGSAYGAYFRIDAGELVNAGTITSDGGPVAASAVTDRVIDGTIANPNGTFAISANTTWNGTTFDNTGLVRFPGAAVLTVPAGIGATFVNDTGGSIVNVYADNGHLLVDTGNTFNQGWGVAGDSFVPGVSPAVVVRSGTLAYTGNAQSNVVIEGQSTLEGVVPAGAQLAIECSGTEPALVHAVSFTNVGAIALIGADPEQCAAGQTLSLDSSAGPGTGTLANVGQISGSGTIVGNLRNTAGTISPGDQFASCSSCMGAYTFGRIRVTRNYEQDPPGTLEIGTVGSGVPGAANSDLLSVGGAAAINGTLRVFNASLGPDVPGELYQVLTASSVAGRFAEIEGTPSTPYNAPYAPTQYAPMYNRGTVTVEVMKVPNLTVKVAGRGWGDVTTVPAGIDCNGGSCMAPFSPLQIVTLIATPSQSGPFEPPSTFVGWSGGGCHGTGRCTLTMDGDKSVTATFIPPQPPRCTLRLNGRTARALRAVAVCSKAAHLKLTGAVTEWLGSRGSSQAVHLQLPPVTRKVARGRTTTLVITLPTAALTALRQGHRETIRLTLRATGAGGTRRVSTRQIALLG
ncbi:MAG TPA: hypothetical protein VGF81_03535 [Solirubrobacteraceae bacterium]